jgi:plasmid stabilization system protein ParE
VKVSLTESAIGDLREIIQYYNDQLVPDIGKDLVSKILVRVEGLTDHPEIGRIVPEFESDNIRELIQSPFRIVYTTTDTTIFIVRIWRSERLLKLPAN